MLSSTGVAPADLAAPPLIGHLPAFRRRRLGTEPAYSAELGERAAEAARTLWSEERHMSAYLGLLGIDVDREGHAGAPSAG